MSLNTKYINTEWVITEDTRMLYLRPSLKNVFVPDVFRLPLFNDVMAQELLKTVPWLKDKISDKRFYGDIEKVISEICEINSKLLNENPQVFERDNLLPLRTNRYFQLMNPEIRFVDFLYAANFGKPETEWISYVQDDILEFFYCTYKTILEYESRCSDKDWLRFVFIHKVFSYLKRGDVSIGLGLY